ncbi:MAG: ROK family protein [Erysipelotrichaceae bacterium]|nr:ROK family protein [Erysipelotrichaceae bacterium]
MNYLLIDAGGSSIKYAMCNDELVLTGKGKVDNKRTSKEEYYRKILSIRDAMPEEIDGIAISMAGKLDVRTGYCYGSAILEDREFSVSEELSALSWVKVSAINDGYAAALAELGYGNMQDAENGAVIVLGTGIGGGLIINHSLYTGAGNAANISFMVSDITDPFSRHSTFAMNNGIRAIKAAIFEKSGLEDIDGLKAFELIRNGNTDVRAGLELFCDRLAFQIYNLQTLLDLDKVLIGGGISNEPTFISYVNEAFDRFNAQVRVKARKPQIINCRYNNDANLLGALYNWKQHYSK